MKRFVLVSLLVLVLSLALTSVVCASDGDPPEGGTVSAGEVALLLAPLVAAATAIERSIEMVFDFIEGIWLGISRVPAEASSYVKWARIQLDDARKDLLGNTNSDDRRKLETALKNAQQRLKAFLKTEPYVSIKRVVSLLLGIALGLVVASQAKLQMFRMLGVDLVELAEAQAGSSLALFLPRMDRFITGLVIGTGSAPVHSLIGILQNSKDALEEVKVLATGKANETQVEMMKLLMREAPEEVPGEAGEVRALGVPPPEGGPKETASEVEIGWALDRLLRR